jgi:hypothetical protein
MVFMYIETTLIKPNNEKLSHFQFNPHFYPKFIYTANNGATKELLSGEDKRGDL